MLCEREKRIFGENAEELHRDADHVACRIAATGGEVVMTAYPVFPGIDIVYHDAHAKACAAGRGETRKLLEIAHCLEGRSFSSSRRAICPFPCGRLRRWKAASRRGIITAFPC